MTRLAHAWRSLGREQRLAGTAAVGLLVSMFLPWYSKTNTIVVGSNVKATQTSLSAFAAFSFVEAAVLLISGGVLFVLFERGEGGDFRLPGGDGLVSMVAGSWAALLIFYRMLDKPGLQGTARVTSSVGVEWGIFIALLVALGLVYAGARMRAAERPSPPLRRPRDRAGRAPQQPREGEPRGPEPREREPLRAREGEPQRSRGSEPAGSPAGSRAPDAGAAARSEVPAAPIGRAAPVRARERPRFPPSPQEQLSFEDPPARPD